MNLRSQKRVAADVLNIGVNKVWFNPEKKEDIKKAITKVDIRELVKQGIIAAKPKKGVSRFRAKKAALQKRKGRRSGSGSRKGKMTSRLPRKKSSMLRIRAQRKLLSLLKEKGILTAQAYRDLRNKAKGGFFRSRRHIKLYAEDRGLMKKDGKK